MNKRIKLISSFLLYISMINAQVNHLSIQNPVCAFDPTTSILGIEAKVIELNDYSNMKNIVDKIKTIVGMEADEITVYESLIPIENAFATIIDGKKIILYDPDFLEKANSLGGSKWAAISIIAHEIGHHYHQHMFSKKRDGASLRNMELEADEISGYVLGKLGAAKEASVKAFMLYGTATNTTTHPDRLRRINAIVKGWEKAKNEK
jgi:hypothetical protein